MEALRHAAKWAYIDEAALAHNVAQIRGTLHESVQIMGMVKANAYGHGVSIVVPTLERSGVERLGVSSIDEALELRDLGCALPILIVGWSDPHEWGLLREQGIEVALHSDDLLAHYASLSHKERPKAHIKVDSGMNRIGIPWAHVDDDWYRVVAQLGEDLVGLFTHCANSDGPSEEDTRGQMEHFVPIAKRAKTIAPHLMVHVANSATAERFAQFEFDCVRPGLSLYGYSCRTDRWDLHPVMQLLATVTQVKQVEAGERIGYGARYQTARPMRVATVCVGYADGVMRMQEGRGRAILRGTPCPFVGAVSMDQITVDCTAVPHVVAGDIAELMGPHMSAHEVAEASRTIPYEVLTAVSPRVERRATPHELARVEGNVSATVTIR